MKVEILNKEDNHMTFKIQDISVSIANMLRRYIINKVEVAAIDKVIFYENTSSFFDEYIAHRIGLIPIIADDKIDLDNITMYADVNGEAVFMSGNIKSTNDKVKVAIPNIPIIKLLEGQSIRIEAKLRRGMGREHAKFQSGIASYEIDGSTFIFNVETLYHFNVETLIKKALDNMEKDLSIIASFFEVEKKETKEKSKNKTKNTKEKKKK